MTQQAGNWPGMGSKDWVAIPTRGRSGTASTSGTTDTLAIHWGESGISNGNDDSRTVSIEIRPIGTTCSSGQQWQLSVRGD